MKKYRPSTTPVMAGIVLMVVGIMLWVLEAAIKTSKLNILFPIGLLCLCLGGLVLTIVAFMTLRKNDLASREYLAQKEAEKEKNNKKVS